ncbi:MAG: hypothetical protein IKN16_10715 [Selenomonadaceae bacterium]|nr:hypothetical protein [Selenomonadaceae bacterium]
MRNGKINSYQLKTFLPTKSSARRKIRQKKIFKRESSPLLKKFLAQRLEKLQHVLDEMNKSDSARASEKFQCVMRNAQGVMEKLTANS